MGPGFTENAFKARLLTVVLATMLLCARPVSAAFDPGKVLMRLHGQDQAVERVGFRLATANADLCPEGADAGFSVQTLEQYGPAYRSAATMLFHLGEYPGVLAVAPGSPAEAAGLGEGDQITGIDDRPAPEAPSPTGHGDFRRTAAVQQQLHRTLAAPVLTLATLHDGVPARLTLHAAPACASLFQVVPDTQLTGEADGDYVQVSSEMASLAMSDDELAGLLAHELAHNVLGHRARLDALHVDRGLMSVFGRNARLIRDTELQADRLAVYLLARAGYAPDRAMVFWTRVRRASPGSFLDTTHPSWTTRLKAIQAEVRRIGDAGVPPHEVPLPPDLIAALPGR